MAYFAVSVFLSAFLLFQIEPMLGKYLLFEFGGSSAVWSTALMFFQILLAGGYAYASWLTGHGSGRKRIVFHIALLAASVILMLVLELMWKAPIFPGSGWQLASKANPVWEICKLLGIAVGLPYFLLAANSTLMQAWYRGAKFQRAPYFLYALSNAGSILGLIGYVLFVEPGLRLREQGFAWSAGYLTFALLTGYGALRSLRVKLEPVDGSSTAATSKPEIGTRALWLTLSACASIMLLATTAQLTQEVAVIPFLWVLPLVLYLLTFIIAFSGERWYSRQVFLYIFIIATILFGRALIFGSLLEVVAQIAFLSIGLFITCLVLHAELYRLRPHVNHLASFYLYIAVGGALGGIFVTLIAPTIFKGYWELPLVFALSWILFACIHAFDNLRRTGTWRRLLNWGLLLYGVIFSMVLAYQSIEADLSNSMFIERNFYGVVRVRKAQIGDPGMDVIQMTHGVTVHGIQFVAPQFRDQPTTYYTAQSGVGLGILHNPHRGQGLRVGVLGLGTGTLAAYGRPGDVYRFYELNPVVIDLAEGRGGYFTFLKDSQAKVEIVPGDARLSLERELVEGSRQDFDLLALDTFNSDSIPIHLIDEQAFDLYLQRLKPDGMLAVHISNRYFDFVPVVWNLAQSFNLRMVLLQNPENDLGGYSSTWVLLSREPASLEDPQIKQNAANLDGYVTDIRLWTDDYSNPLQILR